MIRSTRVTITVLRFAANDFEFMWLPRGRLDEPRQAGG
jgi:hypothetical protein